MSQEALDAMPFPLSIYTCDGLYVGANALVEQLFRVPSSAIIGSFNMLTDPKSQDANGLALFHAAVAGYHGQAPPTYYDFSYPGTRSPTSPGCWIEARYLPFRDATGRVTHVGTMFQDVTDHIEAAQQTALLNMLIANANDCIAMTDMVGRITYANPAYQALTGYGDALIGMTIADIHPDDPAALAAALAQLAEHGSWNDKMPSRRADGSAFPSEVSAFVLRDTKGQPGGIGAIIRDLSERQAQEQRLRLFEMLIENAPDAICITGPEGGMRYANPMYRTLFGCGDDILELDWQAFCPPDVIPLMEAVGQELFANGSWQGIIDQQDKSGHRFPVQLSIFLLCDEDKMPSGFASIIRDISDQQRREGELRTFKAMVENTPDAVGVADSNGVFLYTNPAYRAMVQSDGDMVGTSGLDFIAAEDRAAVIAALANLPEQRVGTVQARYRRNDGSTFPASATIFLQDTPSGAQVIGFVRDISEQQRAEEERTAFQQDVIIAQQAALRELSTPLIPITDGVVAMPLIGSIDSSRAQLVIETLLSGVAESRAHTAIMDITGVPVVDTQVANALLRAAQAIKLLGAQVILTGIRPEVAQTLVGLGVDLRGIITRGTLQSGIAEALARLSATPQPNSRGARVR